MTLSYLSAEAASLEPVLGNVRGNDFVNIDADFEVCELLTDGEIVHSIRATPQEALDAVHTLPSVTCLLRFLVCPFPSLSLASLEKGKGLCVGVHAFGNGAFVISNGTMLNFF